MKNLKNLLKKKKKKENKKRTLFFISHKIYIKLRLTYLIKKFRCFYYIVLKKFFLLVFFFSEKFNLI